MQEVTEHFDIDQGTCVIMIYTYKQPSYLFMRGIVAASLRSFSSVIETHLFCKKDECKHFTAKAQKGSKVTSSLDLAKIGLWYNCVLDMQILGGRLFIGASFIGSRQKDLIPSLGVARFVAMPSWFIFVQIPGVQNK